MDLNEKPIRLQRKFREKQVSPNGLPVAYVGPGTRWESPFKSVRRKDKKWVVEGNGSEKCNELITRLCSKPYGTKDEADVKAITCYSFWLIPYTHKEGSIEEFFESIMNLDKAVAELRGKNLSCWCKLNEKCHADFLLDIANHISNSKNNE